MLFLSCSHISKIVSQSAALAQTLVQVLHVHAAAVAFQQLLFVL